MTFLVTDSVRHWLSISNLFKKTLKWKDVSARTNAEHFESLNLLRLSKKISESISVSLLKLDSTLNNLFPGEGYVIYRKLSWINLRKQCQKSAKKYCKASFLLEIWMPATILFS